MRPLVSILALGALTACPSNKLIEVEGDHVPVGMEVGEVEPMDTTDSGVGVDINVPGKYIVILFSEATEQNTKYGYGDNADQAARVAPMDPMPAGPMSAAPAVKRELPPPPGSTREFTVYDGTSNVTVLGEFQRLTDELVIWKDITTENPLGDIDEETFDGVVEWFEDPVLPRTDQIFGEVPDVDDSGRIDVLVSYTVNTYGAIAYVSGCDIAEFSGCYGRGNGGETIYMSYPDPDSSYSTDTAIVEIWAHELNHLVYYFHKYMGNDQLGASENVYLTEGMSELAQDLTGFNNGNQYIWAAALDMREFYEDEDYSIQGVSINDFLRGTGYYDAMRDGPLRGGAYLFLRYLFEQAGGFSVEDDGSLVDQGGMEFLHAWFDSPELGPDCVEALTGDTVEDTAFDWYTALVVSDRGINDDPRFNYQERVQDPLTTYEFGVNTYATIHGWLTLTGPVVQPIDEADGEIRAGGVEYLLFEMDEAGTIEVPVDSDALARARVFRIE